MKVDEHLLLWDQALVTIMDIRRISLRGGEEWRAYRLPASSFIYAFDGSAEISLDGTKYQTSRFHVLHGGKGMCLDIVPLTESFEFYMMMYRARPALPSACQPFVWQYALVPGQPMSLLNKVQEMDRLWSAGGRVERLQIKGLLYQFIHEVVWELDRQKVQTLQPDLVAQMLLYLQQHYASVVTMEGLADTFNYSARYLNRRFKRDTGYSPIDYLIQLRMNKAKALLLKTNATVQETAASVGYGDMFYFSRLFKKHTGVAPANYAAYMRENNRGPNSPDEKAGYSMFAKEGKRYIDESDENHYQYTDRGVNRMSRNSKQHLIALVLLCTLTLLVSACSGSANRAEGSTNSSANTNTAAVEQQAKDREVTDGLGHKVTVPANPQRVLATYLEDHLVALGVKPVAQWSVKEGKGVQNYLQQELAGIPTIPSELPYEAVISFEPDLIIIDSAEMVEGDKYEQYNKIAPTYAVGTEKNNDWRQELLTVGEVLNKSEEAQKVLENYEQKASEAKEQLKQAIGTQSAAALWVTAKKVYVVNENLSSGDLLYHDLGLSVPAVVHEAASGSANWNAISLEKLAQMDADHLFIVNARGITKEELLKDSLWQGIPAVQKGNVYEYDNQSSWLYTGTIANSQMIDDVLESIIK
ncbi:AraC family transcriptional regulator [Paenibacillus albidus]|uniref:AraC family transcriptional regulator n=1 Tax=Paenibacillus albidus TaxID=2041023 RepID=UPI002035DB82|nr:AraC family transcriptional regulator [Paenibacillus albidus]